MIEGVVEVVLPQTVPVPGVGTPHRQLELLGPLSVSPSLPWLSISPSSLPCSLVASYLSCSKALKSSNHRFQSQTNLSNFIFLVNG